MIHIQRPLLQKILILILAFIVFFSGVLFFQVHHFLHTPAQDPGADIIIHIEPGQTFAGVAALLKSKRLITDQRKFKLLGWVNRKLASIRAGEFRLNTGWLPQRILEELTRGQSILYSLTIPEGLTWWQTAKRVEQAGLGSFASFNKTIHNPALLTAWNIPASSAEGYLFPETYHLQRPENHSARPCVEAMIRTFRKKMADLLPKETPSEKTQRILTLASLVEKETGEKNERTRIAGVFANRLRQHMRLQCDPTIIYGIGPGFNGNLTRKDIQNATNLYNTYTHPGLPPGPICSPGLASIKAALSPEKHPFLYFVAKGDGSHVFSKTLTEHNRAVRRYQLHKK